MDNSGIYVRMTKISEISGGKIDFQIRVRVINLWSTPDRANAVEEGAIHMIFLDEERGRIHATIRKDLISRFKDEIEEGCAYVFERFMVVKNDAVFRTTPHKHKLNFMRGTKVYKVKATEIPMNHFEFMPFQDIFSSTREDCFLDVIGHVVEKNAMKEIEKNGKISKVVDATLEDLEGNRVHCTLWDEFALKMQEFLANHDSAMPVIIIFQRCRLMKFLGVMGISNYFHGSKLFLNAELPEVAHYMERMNASNVELTQVVSQMTGPTVVSIADELLQTQKMTIEDLIESTEKCYGSVLAWTCEFDTDAGWFYQACTKCASRISFTGGQLYCDKCKLPRTAVPRYKVHLQVIDNTGSITFIMFDRIVTQVVGRTAQDLLDSMDNERSSNLFPPELDVFIDKHMLFKIEVTDANLYRNWRGYTVKKISDDADIISRFKELHGIKHGDATNYSQELDHYRSPKRLRINESVHLQHGDRCLGDPIETSYVRHLASIRPRQITFQDHGISLMSHDDVSEMMCTTNAEEYDIPTNSDSGTYFNSNDVVDQMLCVSNTEEYDIPSNSDSNALMEPISGHRGMMLASNAMPLCMPSHADSSFAEYFNIGQPSCICSDCGAIMWSEERLKTSSKRNPKFSLCCSQGDIEIVPYTKLPQPLHNLYHGLDVRSKFFLQNIRSFNSMFAFTSMGGKIDASANDGNAPPIFVMNGENYHQIGSLLPLPGERPKFAQLYIYDTENEISNRMSSVRMEDDALAFRSSIVKDVREALDNCNNPYVRTYNTVRDTLHLDGTPAVRLRILGKRGRDGRRYNLPTASEVAALIVGDFDSADFDRDVVVETQSGLLQRISTFEPSYWPLQYPLLFPRGEDGYRKDIEFKDNARKATRKRQFITQLEWVGYRIQQREIENSTIVFSRRLFHQFLVDSFSTIESARLKYLRDHQKDLRADMYKGLTEAILRGETDAATTGKRIVLPATFVGGARYTIQNYQDAMAICSWAGYPDLFITFTCNHKWPEVVDFLKTYRLRPGDRPDLVSRLFKIKLDQLIKDIKKGNIFGKVKAVIYTIEFQKRGLPHAHILVFLQSVYRIVHPDGIDRIISAEIPDKERDPELFQIVSTLMIHGPCGDQNKSSPCMLQSGRCSKHFPKRFVTNTFIDSEGYPVYRRRDNGVFIKKGESFADNRFVVPYNRHLLLKYNAHINVEWCNQSRSVKYLFKYVNKGHDRVTAGFYRTANGRDSGEVFDEIKMYHDCRYLSACEAVWRIFVFDVNYREPSVERLGFHLENEQPVIYPDEASIEEVVSKPHAKYTKFLAWMEANKKYPYARALTYNEFPTKFVWNKKDRKWTPRKKGFSIGRLHFVPPGSGQKFYLRTLLNYIRGPTSFDELRTVNNVKYDNYKDTCFALGLMDDDKEFVLAIKEAAHWGTGVFLRNLFVALLLSGQLNRPSFVWNNTWEDLSDDIQQRQRRLLNFEGLLLTPDQLKSYALAEIESLLQSNGKSLENYPDMPRPDPGLLPEIGNRLIYDELNYDRQSLIEEHRKLMSTMTAEQRRVYDRIMTRIDKKRPGLFFLYGYGGTGKTYIWRALSAALRSEGEIVLAVASSGIASLLIPGGRTAHSRFAIPLNVNEYSTCEIGPKEPAAQLIRRAKLIIWDEAPMMHRHCFEVVDRTLKDIMQEKEFPFGGKVVVLGGDFRQILPVIPKGTRHEIVHSTINSSPLWRHCEVLTLTTNMRLLAGGANSDIEDRRIFSEWILGIGDGSTGDADDECIAVQIPKDLLIHGFDDPLAAIVESTYPDLLNNMNDPSFFQNRAILAPKNVIVDAVNDYILNLIPGEEKMYLSYDSPCSVNSNVDVPDDVHTPEFLNTIVTSGLPNHKLKLKVGVPVTLMRNMNQSLGLCNGTRLIVTKLGKYVIEGKILSGSNIGERVFIPRLSLIPSDKRLPFKFQRRQFPLTLSFAMTINKSQGQSLQYVGVYLPHPIFSHGQLYVALSRVTSKQGLKILITNDNGEDSSSTQNVVYREVFRNI